MASTRTEQLIGKGGKKLAVEIITFDNDKVLATCFVGLITALNFRQQLDVICDPVRFYVEETEECYLVASGWLSGGQP